MFNVLYEDNHILVCEKPAGIPTQAGKITEKDMVSEVNNYMRKAGDKSPAYLIHRLDKPVRGILVFAKTKQAAADLNRQMTAVLDEKAAKKGIEKRYIAIVEGSFTEKEGILDNYIYKDGNRAYIDELNNKPDSKRALLKYAVIEEKSVEKQENATHICKIDIELLTGRFHQIRCQLSNIEHPIVGDTLYGSTTTYEKRKAIGLTAYSLSFIHPFTKEKLNFEIPV